MSAYLCTDRHITALAHFIKQETYQYRDADIKELAQELLNENIKSLIARYGNAESKHAHQVDCRIPSDCLWIPNLGKVQLARGYSYQACEHEGWKDSEAKNMIDRLESALITKEIEKSGASKYWSLD